MKLELLGGISPKKFLRNYWQKKPLLVRGALPGFQGLLAGTNLSSLPAEMTRNRGLLPKRMVNGKSGMDLLHPALFPGSQKNSGHC